MFFFICIKTHNHIEYQEGFSVFLYIPSVTQKVRNRNNLEFSTTDPSLLEQFLDFSSKISYLEKVVVDIKWHVHFQGWHLTLYFLVPQFWTGHDKVNCFCILKSKYIYKLNYCGTNMLPPSDLITVKALNYTYLINILKAFEVACKKTECKCML